MTTEDWLNELMADPKRWNLNSAIAFSCDKKWRVVIERFWCDWEWEG